MKLDQRDYGLVAEKLGDSPTTVIPLHFILRGRTQVYTDDAREPRNLLIVFTYGYGEAFASGPDSQVLAQLCIEAQVCKHHLWAPAEAAEAVAQVVQEHASRPVERLPQLHRILTTAPPAFLSNPPARLLTSADLELIEQAPPQFAPALAGWESRAVALSESGAAAVVLDGGIVSLACVFARTPRHADIAVHTLQDFRSRGYSTACAALVARVVLESGRTPTWTVQERNLASVRISEKLGFQTVARSMLLV